MTGLNRIKMKADGQTAEILIYEDIGQDWWTGDGVTAKSFMLGLQSLGDVTGIDLRINSYGGDVFEGLAIYNALVNHPAVVNVFVDGIAASIATVVAMAGDNISMAENAMFMIHEPYGPNAGYWTADDHDAQASLLRNLIDSSVGIYAARSKMAEADVRAAMKVETWYSAADAKRAGFVDTVTPNKSISASLTPRQFAKAPVWVQKRLQSFQKGSAPMSDAKPEDKTADVEALKAQVNQQATQIATMKADLEAATKLLEEKAKPVEQKIDVEAIKAEAKADAIKQERDRQTMISALCVQAKRPEMAAALCEDATMTVEGAQQKLFAALCADSKPIGDEGGTAGDGKRADDGNDKYRQEFKNTPAYAKDFTEEQYIAMRRIDDGLDELKFTKKTK